MKELRTNAWLRHQLFGPLSASVIPAEWPRRETGSVPQGTGSTAPQEDAQ